MDEVKSIMLNRGQIFLQKLEESRHVIAKHAMPFITDGCVSLDYLHIGKKNSSSFDHQLFFLKRILTHSRSRVILETLRLAAKQNKNFHVFVTMSSIDDEGKLMIEELRNDNIECTLILDASIGYIMETIDFVLIGAEGVMESGGIINRIGTFTMALCAKEMKKPFYVLTESFKFSRLYPLNQRDLPNNYKYPKNSENREDFAQTHPLVDYTPPLNITLIFTDLGILTPSAVSDELIKLY
jgi:translation initiation factor eIF-2B subunit alpha